MLHKKPREIFSFAHVSPSLSLYIYIQDRDDDDDDDKKTLVGKMGLDLDSCIERVRASFILASLSRAFVFLSLLFSLGLVLLTDFPNACSLSLCVCIYLRLGNNRLNGAKR
jgi:hypothetical protein